MSIEHKDEPGYETRDAPVSPAAVGLVVLVVLMVVGFVGGKVFEDIFRATEVRSRPETEPMVKRETVEGPLLQAYPPVELGAYLADERSRLSSYAWIDREAGVVRIPIERAMALVASEGFPRWEAINALSEQTEEASPEGSETGSEVPEGGEGEASASAGYENAADPNPDRKSSLYKGNSSPADPSPTAEEPASSSAKPAPDAASSEVPEASSPEPGESVSDASPEASSPEPGESVSEASTSESDEASKPSEPPQDEDSRAEDSEAPASSPEDDGSDSTPNPGSSDGSSP